MRPAFRDEHGKRQDRVPVVGQAAMPDATTGSALLYFCLGCGVMVSCVFGYLSLVRSSFASHHLAKGSRVQKVVDSAEKVRVSCVAVVVSAKRALCCYCVHRRSSRCQRARAVPSAWGVESEARGLRRGAGWAGRESLQPLRAPWGC